MIKWWNIVAFYGMGWPSLSRNGKFCFAIDRFEVGITGTMRPVPKLSLLLLNTIPYIKSAQFRQFEYFRQSKLTDLYMIYKSYSRDIFFRLNLKVVYHILRRNHNMTIQGQWHKRVYGNIHVQCVVIFLNFYQLGRGFCK